MVHDYSRRYSQVLQRRQPVRQAEARPWLLSRFLGTVMLAVAIGGVGVSFWIGHQVSTGLAGLRDATAQRQVLAERKARLEAQRNAIRTRDAVVARAAALDLAPPTKAQIIPINRW